MDDGTFVTLEDFGEVDCLFDYAVFCCMTRERNIRCMSIFASYFDLDLLHVVPIELPLFEELLSPFSSLRRSPTLPRRGPLLNQPEKGLGLYPLEGRSG